MIFFFGHDVPEDAAFALESLGHQVIRLREVLPTTTTDGEVFRYVNANDYICTEPQQRIYSKRTESDQSDHPRHPAGYSGGME